MPEQALKALMATVHLDQLLYDRIIRKQEYPRAKIILDYMDDFFVLTLAQKLEHMFVPLDHLKFPEQIGRVVSLSTLQLNTAAKCRILYATYPCEYIRESDKLICSKMGIYTCHSKNSPPHGYEYGTWPVTEQLQAQIAARRSYQPNVYSPAMVLEERRVVRTKRAAMKPIRFRPRWKKRRTLS